MADSSKGNATFAEITSGMQSSDLSFLALYPAIGGSAAHYLGGRANNIQNTVTGTFIGVMAGFTMAYFRSAARIDGHKQD